MKTFEELEIDKNSGVELEAKNKKNPVYFLGGTILTDMCKKKYLEPLLISKHKSIVDGYMGRFPTIYLDLKCIGYGKDVKEILDSLSNCICREYKRHSYLKLSPKLTERDKKIIIQILDSNNIQIEDLSYSLKNFLSEFLRKHWNHRVFVFVDEYDAPINKVLWNETFPRSSINEVIAIFSDLFSNLLKTNDNNVEMALLTGILNIEQYGFLSGKLNNIIKLTPSMPRFCKNYYGFREDEIKLLVRNNGIEEKYLKMIKKKV